MLGQHRYRAPGGDGDPDADAVDEADDAAERARALGGGVRVAYDERLYGPRSPDTDLPLSTAFLRKYVAVAKARGAGRAVTGPAAEAIGDFYADLRAASDEERPLPVTVRTLETVIRLATAAAKARLATDGARWAVVGCGFLGWMVAGGRGGRRRAARGLMTGRRRPD